jgi:hypothetical protein
VELVQEMELLHRQMVVMQFPMVLAVAVRVALQILVLGVVMVRLA